MNMIIEFDRASSALSKALNSKEFSVVLKGYDDLALIRTRAKQLKDRRLLADAMEFQMRVERWLGLLLNEAIAKGILMRKGGDRRSLEARTDESKVRLADIGVDRFLAVKAKAAAALDQSSFDAAVAEMRSRLAGSRAKVVEDIRYVDKNIRKSTRQTVFALIDGKRIEDHRVGNLRSRIDTLLLEAKVLQRISERIGANANAIAPVSDFMSQSAIELIVEEVLASRH